jgi:hypothetical protein
MMLVAASKSAQRTERDNRTADSTEASKICHSLQSLQPPPAENHILT